MNVGFKHFGALQRIGMAYIANLLVMVPLSYWINTLPITENDPVLRSLFWPYALVSLLGAIFALIFIEYPGKDGYKSERSNRTGEPDA